MIHAPERLGAPAARLLEAITGRGATPEVTTLAVGLAAGFAPSDVAPLAARVGAERLVVLGLLGTHRDARAPELRRLWEIEEAARATGRPTLALRFGPLLGPATPLWRKLATRPRLAAPRRLVCPVAEEDAIATLERGLRDDALRHGWYEVASGDALRLDELVALARGADPGDGGAWEPSLEILGEQRLADPAPWLEDFGLAPPALTARARKWAA